MRNQVSRAASPEDGELVVRVRDAQSGDTEALRRFLLAIAPTVRRTCGRVLGSGHPDLPDAIQESLYAVVKALPRYRFGGSVHSYVATIALRKSLAMRRIIQERWRRSDVFENQLDVMEAPSTDSLLDGQTLVRRILAGPVGPQTEALLMRLVLGMSIEEISAATGVGTSAVKTRLRRGKADLRHRGGKPSFWSRLLSRGGERHDGQRTGG